MDMWKTPPIPFPNHRRRGKPKRQDRSRLATLLGRFPPCKLLTPEAKTLGVSFWRICDKQSHLHSNSNQKEFRSWRVHRQTDNYQFTAAGL